MPSWVLTVIGVRPTKSSKGVILLLGSLSVWITLSPNRVALKATLKALLAFTFFFLVISG